MATIASLRDYILKLFESNKENILSEGEFHEKMHSAITALVALKEHTPLQLSSGLLLCFCSGLSEKDDSCEAYFTRSRINGEIDALLCCACERRETNRKRRDREAQASTIYSHDEPRSHCNLRWLTKEQLAERYNKLKKENLKVASNLKKLANEISGKTKHENLCLTEESRSMFSAAMSAAKSEHGRNTMQNILMNLLKNDASCTQEATTSSSEFVNAIAEEMTAFSMKLRSGEKQVRFSPRVLRIALSIWLKSPKTYREYKKSSLLCLPSITTLKKLKHERSVNDGIFLKIYERHKQQRSEKVEVGHLMCDEMKLVEGLLWNTSTHAVDGFASDDITDLSSLLRNACSDEKTEEIATSINQWRFRSVSGKVFNCEFFSNQGTLNGDNLLRQLLHVTMACEAIGCEVHGFVCDAGGNNARLMKLLRKGEASESAWLPKEMVAIPNPFDNTRNIIVWHCVTHVFKALRNAFHSSRPNGTRAFMDTDGSPFGFQFIVNSLHRDELRAVPKTDLSKKSVYIKGWSAMNVAATKSVFSERTISEGIAYLSDKLKTKVTVSEIKESDSRHIISACGKENLRRGLFYGAVVQLKKRANSNQEELKSELAALEFMTVVGAMFNELLMNSSENIKLSNIDAREEYVKYYLQYFHSWSESAKSRRKPGEKGVWQKYFLAAETWLNLRLCITGFFAYCRQVLQRMVLVTNSKIEPYVPVLHGNTSSLEAWFSCMRGNNCNTIQTYRSGAGAVDASNAVTFLQNNKAYDAADIAEEEADKMLPTGVFQSVEKHRQKYLDNWLAAIDEEKKNNNDQSVLPYGTEFYGGASRKGIELFNKLCSKKPKGHFVYIIAAEEQFRRRAVQAMGSPFLSVT